MRNDIRRVLIFVTLLIGLVHRPTAAGVLEVPSDYPTINEAVEAAVDGDTVRVAPGVFVENIDFHGKAILLTSHYIEGGDWNLVETTIIDGCNSSVENRASTVSFHSNEGRDSILQGFTITGGKGTLWVDPEFPTYTWRGGGGIHIFQSSPTIRFAIIDGNRVQNPGDVSGAQGGGILCFGGDPLIHNLIITNNEAEYGGGLVVDYSGATVRNTIIGHNMGGASYGGGGVWTIGNGATPILLENCVIDGNISPTLGGAIYLWSSVMSLRNSIVWNNEQASGDPIAVTRGATINVEYCDVEDGWDGESNLDLDPLFEDTVRYLLLETSPVVDCGDPGEAFNDREDEAEEGMALPPALGTVRNDMGVYGGPGGCAYEHRSQDGRQSWLVPAVVHAPGVADTQWRTSLACLNAGSEDAEIDLELLLEDQIVERAITLQPGASVEWIDVVIDLFGFDVSEVTAGALVLSATYPILISSRVYNQAEDGTFGQTMPALSEAHCFGGDDVGYLMHIKSNSDFRTNVGLANRSEEEVEVWVQLYDERGTMIGSGILIVVDAWTQVNDVFSETSAGEHDLAFAIVTPSGEASIWAYASVVDNATGDATTIPVQVLSN